MDNDITLELCTIAGREDQTPIVQYNETCPPQLVYDMRKCLKVIASCQTSNQIEAATTMIELFQEKHHELPIYQLHIYLLTELINKRVLIKQRQA